MGSLFFWKLDFGIFPRGCVDSALVGQGADYLVSLLTCLFIYKNAIYIHKYDVGPIILSNGEENACTLMLRLHYRDT